MIRTLCNIAAFSLVALPAFGQESAVIGEIPAGVIIYDAEPVSILPSIEPPVVQLEPSSDNVVVPEIQSATAPMTQSLASTRSSGLQALPPVEAGVVLDAATVAPQVDLAPGETVLQVIAVPSIVKIPAPQPVYTATFKPDPAPVARTTPEPIVDPVTGRLRDTPGWTGDTAGPASIGCFPAGACAVLNQR